MQQQRRYYVIEEMRDKRKKFNRIVDGLAGPSAEGRLYVKKDQVEFIDQFIDYSPAISHDDIIETVAVGCEKLSGYAAASVDDDENEWDMLLEEEKDLPKLTYKRGAP